MKKMKRHEVNIEQVIEEKIIPLRKSMRRIEVTMLLIAGCWVILLGALLILRG